MNRTPRLASTERPAIAGGAPIFERRLPIVSPEGLPGPEVLRDFEQVLTSRQLTNGARVREFEEAAAAYLGVPHCVAVSSCTSGLMLVLQALGLRGDVILPSFTFHATAHSAVWNGLRPVFADCEPDTFCLSAESVSQRLSSHTTAILAVHMYGNPCNVAALEAIAADQNIALVFDSAHAFGSTYDRRHIGTFGAAEVFSLSPTKLLVAGEGGLVTTQDAELARRLRAARNYGDSGTYDPELLGINARMSELHATVALYGLRGIEQRIARRNQIRLRYEHRLRRVQGLSFQKIRAACRSTCKDFSILVNTEAFGASRDWLHQALHHENIESKRYFFPPVHRQKLYQSVWDGRPLPVTETVSEQVLSLPIYSALSDSDVDKVCEAIEHAQQFAARSGQLAAAAATS